MFGTHTLVMATSQPHAYDEQQTVASDAVTNMSYIIMASNFSCRGGTR
jgi:hypothetical protein